MSRNTSPKLREKIGNHIFGSGVAYTIYEEQLKLNNKKTTQLKKGLKKYTHTSPKKIHRRQINMYKGT